MSKNGNDPLASLPTVDDLEGEVKNAERAVQTALDEYRNADNHMRATVAMYRSGSAAQRTRAVTQENVNAARARFQTAQKALAAANRAHMMAARRSHLRSCLGAALNEFTHSLEER